MNIRERIEEMGLENVVVFSEHIHDDAIVALSHDYRVVYDYDKLVQGLITHDHLTEEQAREWIDYNMIRSLGYVENGPIVIHGLGEE